MQDKQKNLIDAAKLGKIIDMYRLIADGVDPFIFLITHNTKLELAVYYS